MKKIISIALVFAMVVSVLGSMPYTESPFMITARATESSYFMIEPDFTGEEGVWITGFYGGISDVVIPSEYEGVPVIGIREFAFEGCEELTSVVIPDSVKAIGERAFCGCSNLVSATVSGNISRSAFASCTSLSEVTFLPTVQTIGENAFENCALKDIAFPESLLSIERCAFQSNMELESIILPAGLEYMSAEAFCYCDWLLYIFFKGTEAQWNAINGSAIIENIYPVEPDSYVGVHYGTTTHTINGYAYFTEPSCTEAGEGEKRCEFCCYKEHEVFPATGHKMNGWVLAKYSTCTTHGAMENHCLNCNYYESEEIPLLYHDFVDGCCVDCGEALIEYDYNEEYGYAKVIKYNGHGDVVIPDEVNGYPITTIWNDVFAYSEDITSIEFGKNVDFFSPNIFKDCVNLENIYVSENNEFFNSVDGILFSEDGKSIVRYPNGRKNKSYTIPEAITAIGDYAFEYCESLENVKIHDNVTEIGCNAFSHCSALTTIKIPDGVKRIAAYSFYGCTNLESAVIGNGVEEISSRAFSECSSLNNISFGTGLKRLGTVAFADCTGITHIELPYGLEEIGAYAFENCTNLVSITLPVTVTLVSSSAFSHSGLAFIFYKGTKEQFDAIGCGTAGSKVHYETDYHIFEDNLCNFCSMKEFEFTWTVTTVDITKYNGRSEVVTVPERLSNRDVVSISEGAFACVEGIVVPESVKLIDEGAINSDALIYCYENSYAQTFAEENGYVYETIAVHSVDENTHVDYYNKLIISSGQSCDDLETVVATSADYDLFADGKPVAESTAYYGTGSVIDVYDEGTLVDSFTMVIEGDTNGDSVCDALDATQVALASNGNGALNGVYKLAADSDLDNQVDVDDYQAIVNKALSL